MGIGLVVVLQRELTENVDILKLRQTLAHHGNELVVVQREVSLVGEEVALVGYDGEVNVAVCLLLQIFFVDQTDLLDRIVDGFLIEILFDLRKISVFHCDVVGILAVHHVHLIYGVELTEALTEGELVHDVLVEICHDGNVKDALPRDLGELRQRTALALGFFERLMRQTKKEENADEKSEYHRHRNVAYTVALLYGDHRFRGIFLFIHFYLTSCQNRK